MLTDLEVLAHINQVSSLDDFLVFAVTRASYSRWPQIDASSHALPEK